MVVAIQEVTELTVRLDAVDVKAAVSLPEAHEALLSCTPHRNHDVPAAWFPKTRVAEDLRVRQQGAVVRHHIEIRMTAW
jgi:hypothetical protein